MATPGNTKFKNFLRSLLVVLVSIIVPLLLIEVGFRLFAPQNLELNVSQWDPHYGWLNRPGATGFHKTPEFDIKIHIDSVGFRYPEITRAKPPGTYRVLGLGDSFTFGNGVPGDSCFLADAERELNARSRRRGGPQIQLINTGVGAWGNAQEYLFFTHEGMSFQPDAVVLEFCVQNDFDENITGGVLKVRGDSLIPVTTPETRIRSMQRALWSIPGYQFLSQHSHLVNFFRHHLADLQQKARAKHAQKLIGMKARKGWRGSAELVKGKGAPPESLLAAYKLHTATVILDALVAATRTNNVPLLVFFMPGYNQCAPGGWKSDPYRSDPRANEINVARLSAHLDSLGVPILNPVNELREASKRELLYYPRDGHLNTRGTQIVGHILAERLVAENMVP
jgi:hypothetical protein